MHLMTVFLTSTLVGEPLADGTVDRMLNHLLKMGESIGRHLLTAIVVYIIGRWVVKFLNHLMQKFLDRSKWDAAVKGFVGSMVNVLLVVLLVLSIVHALGVDNTSLAALLASAGVAIGMAMSGNLSNFASGLIVLLFEPYKINNWIEAQGKMGKVVRIGIFYTVIETVQGDRVHIPNSLMSSAVVVNRDQCEIRRVEWIVGITYGNDVDYASQLIRSCLDAEPLVLPKNELPKEVTEPYDIHLHELGASSVNIRVRAYCRRQDFYKLRHNITCSLYKKITADEHLDFPFNTQTIEFFDNTPKN